MKHLRRLSVCGIFAGWLAVMSGSQAQDVKVLHVALAGTSEKGMTMFERAGLYRFKELRVVGNESAVPETILSLINAQCRP
jgi:hypothetical protein